MSPRHRKTIVSCSLHNFLAFPPRTVACFSFLPSPPLCSGNPRKQKPNCRPVRGCKEARATNERALWLLASSTLAPGAFRLQFSPNSGWLIADRRTGPVFVHGFRSSATWRSSPWSFFPRVFLSRSIAWTFHDPLRSHHETDTVLRFRFGTHRTLCERFLIARTRGPATILLEITRDSRSSYYHLCVE